MKPLLAVILVLLGVAAPAQLVRIGVSLSSSDNYAEQSSMLEAGYRLWADDVNARGGLLGRPVELIILDDRGEPELCRENYRELIEDEQVDLVLAPYSSPLTLAATEVTEAAGYPLIATGAASHAIWERGYRYVFGMYALADRFFIGYLDILAREGFQTVAIVHEDNLFNRETAAGASDWAARFGLDVVVTEEINTSSPDLDGILARVQEAAPDGVVVSSYITLGYEILSVLERTGYRPRSMAMTIIPISSDFAARVGDRAENVFAPSQWEPSERIPFPGTREFLTNFEREYGRQATYHAASAYGSCQMLERAVRAVGGIDRNAIRDYIASVDTVTVMGRFRADPQGKQVGHNSIIIQWQDGAKEIVYPREMRTAEPRFDR
jgi:branched-chain amino acid transport system substrate-binding protein